MHLLHAHTLCAYGWATLPGDPNHIIGSVSAPLILGNEYCKGVQVPRLGLPLREFVPVAQLRDARPDVLVGRAQQLEYVQQLLQLAVPREQGRLRCLCFTGCDLLALINLEL